MAKTEKEKDGEAPTVKGSDKMQSFIDSLAANGTISADVAGIIKHAIGHRAAELD